MAEDSVAQDQIKAFVDRILRLKEEAKAINSDVREIYAEAKGFGFDKTVLGQLVSYVEKRQTDAAALAERSALFDLYLDAFDGAVGRPSHTHTREKASKLTYGDHLDDATRAAVDPVAALRANPALSIVGAADLKKSETQSAPQAGRDLTTPAPLNSQVASIQEPAAPKSAPDSDNTTVSQVETAAEAKTADQEPTEVSGSGEVQDESAIHLATNCQPGKSVEASASAAPATIYAAPGVITWEVAPPEGVQRHDFSAAFGDLGQDLVVIGDEISSARAEPIVKIGNVILDGWARYMVARGAIGLDGHSTEYSVVQYDGADPLMDCIKWNLAGRILNETQRRLIAQRLAKLQPKRKNDIYAAMDMGMELVS